MKPEEVVRLLDRAGCSCVIWADLGGFYVAAYKRNENGDIMIDQVVYSNCDDYYPTIAKALEVFALSATGEETE